MKMLDIHQRPPLLPGTAATVDASTKKSFQRFATSTTDQASGRILKSCQDKSLQTAAAPFCQTSKRFNFQSYTSQVNGMHLKHYNPMHKGLEELQRNIKKCNGPGEMNLFVLQFSITIYPLPPHTPTNSSQTKEDICDTVALTKSFCLSSKNLYFVP